VEKGLALFLGRDISPSDGYRLAVDFCQHHDSRLGNSLNGPSRERIIEISRFIHECERVETGEAS